MVKRGEGNGGVKVGIYHAGLPMLESIPLIHKSGRKGWDMIRDGRLTRNV